MLLFSRGLWRNGLLLGVVEEWFTARLLEHTSEGSDVLFKGVSALAKVNRIDPVANEFNQ